MSNLIFIGLSTHMRPKMLEETLKSLGKLLIPDEAELMLLVTDNDGNESARKVFEKYAPSIPFTSYYLCNQHVGTVHQRNLIISEALKKNATHVAMIDDDETASPEWMVKMLQIMEKYDADVVDGAVERILPSGTPKWMIKGGFYEWHSFKTGSIRRAASGANCLYKVRLIKEMGLRFHPAFNLTGGSDTFFFTQSSKGGAKIVWYDERLVKEYLPKSRVNVRWLRMRSFRRTNSKFLRKRLEMGYFRASLIYSFNGIFQLFSGALIFILLAPFGPIMRVQGQRVFMKGLGTFNGILGRSYQEYSDIHGH